MKPATTQVFFLDHSFQAANVKFKIEEQLSNNKQLYSEIVNNNQSVNQDLCLSLGYRHSDLPWNQLRALQFDLNKKLQLTDNRHTLACCDPVMMQVTHRGAYLWGQDGLNFTNNEVISIIARINEQLMGKGESFYLLNNKQWLYVNEKEIELIQPSFESEIGRDQFGFCYQGKDREFWSRLSTEIQMLIKQMIDYEGLTGVPPESLVNVHFWGNSEQQFNTPIILDKKESLNLFANQSILSQFFEKGGCLAKSLSELKDIIEGYEKNKLVICTREDDDYFSKYLNNLVEFNWSKKAKSRLVEMIFQDCTIILQSKRSFWQRLFND